MGARGLVASPTTFDAKQLLEGYAAGRLSPVEVTSAQLDKVHSLNSQLGAFVAIDEQAAYQAAEVAERSWDSWRKCNPNPQYLDWQQLPTWGVPVSVKDTIELEGLPTTYGSVAFKDNYKPDSPVVSKLREAGGVILGKTNTSEFALSMVTATRVAPPARNPYDPARTAGGSSGGAAAATAAGLGNVGLGTDSVGSIRQPAAYCGLYGLKPTFGAIKNRQTWRASPVRSHLGPLARNVNDLIYSWRVLTGDNAPIGPLETTQLGQQLRIASLAQDPDDGTVLEPGFELLSQLKGATREITALRAPQPPPVHGTNGDWLFAADHYAAAERLWPGFMETHREQLTGYTRQVYDIGARIPAWEYRTLGIEIEDFRVTSQQIFDHTDLIVTSVADVAPVLDETNDLENFGPDYPMLPMWNLAGSPALSIPLPVDNDGLPRSIQVIARQGQDRLLLSLALSLSQLSHPLADATR